MPPRKKHKINDIAYMIIVKGQGEPRIVHTSHAEAVKEAHRLTDKHPNRLVTILQITDQYEGKVTPVKIPLEFPLAADLEDIDIPF